LFNGRSLTNIRILNGLSRNELAEEVGITEQAIWQFENGYTTPRLDVINRLKDIFNVKSIYFYKNDLLEEAEFKDNIRSPFIAYRSETINSVKKSQSESMHVRFIDAFLNKIEGRVKYPENVFLQLREEIIVYLKENKDIPRDDQIYSIAMYARKKLGLSSSNNENLLYLLEKSGCFIFEKEIGERIDAYSVWSEDDRPYIILGNMKKSAVRRNFDLAHELGHLLMHYKVEFTMQDKDRYKDLEKEANKFASEFLLPRKQFINDFSFIERQSNPDAYLDLKKKWLVSMQAIAVRAMNLELITYQQYRYFFISINKKGYKYKEPLDDVILINRPGKVKSVLKILFENQLLSMWDLTEQLKVDCKFLSELTGIELNFFNEYLDKSKRFSVANLEVDLG